MKDEERTPGMSKGSRWDRLLGCCIVWSGESLWKPTQWNPIREGGGEPTIPQVGSDSELERIVDIL